MRKQSNQLVFLLVLLVLAVIPASADEAFIIAVLPFDNLTQSTEHEWLGAGIMETVITDLMNVKEWVVVDRSNLEKRLGEIDLSLSDLSSADSQLVAGNQLAANTIITGSYQVVGKKILINIQLIRVESGKVMKASKMQGGFPDDFFTLQSRIVLNLINDINGFNVEEARATAEITSSLEEAVKAEPKVGFSAFELFHKAEEAVQAEDYRLAERYITDALAKNPEFGDALQLAGHINLAQQRFDEALDFGMRALEQARKEGDQRKEIGIQTFLGDVYRGMGDNNEAYRAYRGSLDLRESYKGHDHPSTAWGYHDLGAFQMSINRPDRALPLFEEALNIRTAILKPDHWVIGDTLTNMASAFHVMGKTDEALRYYQRGLEILDKSEGGRNINAAFARFDLGTVLIGVGEPDKALAEVRKAIDVFEQVFGRDHLTTSEAYGRTAWIYTAMEMYDEALKLFTSVVRIRENKLGLYHSQTAQAYYERSSFYRDALQDFEASLADLRNVLAIRERVFGRIHPETAAAIRGIAAGLQGMGNLEEALSYFQDALSIYSEIPGREHSEIAWVHYEIGNVYRNGFQNPAKALEHFQEALAIHERVTGPVSLNVAWTCHDIGQLYRDNLSDFAKSLEYLNRALAIREKILGFYHLDTASVLQDVARVFIRMERYPEASEAAGKVVQIFQRVRGDDHQETASVQSYLGFCLFRAGRLHEALSTSEKALFVFERSFGSDALETKRIYRRIGMIWDGLGDKKKSEEFIRKAE